MITRTQTTSLQMGSIQIGGKAPISVQSMTTVPTCNTTESIEQIKKLERIGCDIIRVSVPNMKAAKMLDTIKQNISIPLVADIHFDYRLALEAIKRGVDGLRLNPGNIQKKDKIEAILYEARPKKLPIRIGVNSGSLDKKKYPKATAENMVNSALEHITILEKFQYPYIKISLKATDVTTTIQSYRLMAETRKYPLHLGITESGTLQSGSVISSVGLGILLEQGLGNTIRVSVAADPIHEIRIAQKILEALHLAKRKSVRIIACPTCGRCDINLIEISKALEERTAEIQKNITIAIMGCIVNGPGEATQADIGISGGKGIGTLYKKGILLRKVPEADIVDSVMEEIKNIN